MMSSCGKDESTGENTSWNLVLKADSLEGYERFIVDFSDSQYAAEAASLARGIMRERALRPDVYVTWEMPGWIASELESKLDADIAATLGSLSGLQNYSTVFRDGSVEVAISFGVASIAAADLKRVGKAAEALSDLLPDKPRVQAAVHRDAMWPWTLVVLHGDLTTEELSRHAHELEARLWSIGASVELSGVIETGPHMEVRLDEPRCRLLDINVSDVFTAIGMLGDADFTLMALEEAVVSKRSGQEIQIQDLARVVIVEAPVNTRSSLNGANAVTLRMWLDPSQTHGATELQSILAGCNAISNLSVEQVETAQTTVVQLATPLGTTYPEAFEVASFIAKGLSSDVLVEDVLVEIDSESPHSILLTALGPIDIQGVFEYILNPIPGISVQSIRRPWPEQRGATIAVAITGSDWDQIDIIRDDLIHRCASMQGVELIWGDDRATKSELSIEFDPVRLAERGMTEQEAAADFAVRIGTGRTALDGRVTVMMESDDGFQSLYAIDDWRRDGVEVKVVQRPMALHHLNGQRTARIELIVFDMLKVESVQEEIEEAIVGASVLGIQIRCLSN